MSFKHSLLALGVASTFLLAGCGGGGGGPGEPRLNVPEEQDPTQDQTEQQGFCDSTTAFEVAEFVPADGATGVALNANVRITFNANVDADSVPGNVRIVIDGANPIALEEGSPRVIGRSIVLNPLDDLQENTEYTIEADPELRADCGEGSAKSLGSLRTASFTSGDQSDQDTTSPTIVSSDPETGESLAPRDTKVFVEFDEPIDPTSVNSNNFVVTQLDSSGNSVGTIEGALNPSGNSVEFTPNTALPGQTFFKVNVGSSITDLAGNNLTEAGEFTFRTGGLVLALNDGVVSQIPGLGEGVNLLVGTLLDPLAFGDSEDGLSSLDNLLILQIPLIDGLQNLAPEGAQTTTVNGVEFTDFTSALVAVCDPKTVTNTDNGVDVRCTLALDLGLDATQLASLADAFTGGNPEQVPDLLLGFFEGLLSGDLSAVPPEMGELFKEGDGLGLNLFVLDDNSVPLPAPLENGLVELLNTLGQVPGVGDLLSQEDGKPLVELGLLEGELLGVSAGNLLSVGVLSGFETFVGPNGVLNLGGVLFDTLLELSPIGGGDGGTPPNPEDLPLIGDLLMLLDAGDFLGGDGFDPNNLPIIGQLADLVNGGEGFDPSEIPVLGALLSALDPGDFDSGNLPLIGDLVDALNPETITDGDLPLIGDLISLLDPETITEGDIPVIGELFEQLLELGQGGGENPLNDLPLIGDLINLIQGGAADSPLADLLDPSRLEAIPGIGDLFGGLLGAFPG